VTTSVQHPALESEHEGLTISTGGWLGVDVSHFLIYYKLGGHYSAQSQLFEPPISPLPTLPVPFSTPEVPFLLPEAIQRLLFGIRIKSAFAQPVFWGVRVKMFELNNPQPITSTGFDPKGKPFDYRDGPVTGPVQPNATAGAGFTPLSVEPVENVTPPSHLSQYQPGDLKLGVPVRLNITVRAHSAAPQTDANLIPDVGNKNVIDVWIKRVASA
jgi:hypothetical protein